MRAFPRLNKTTNELNHLLLHSLIDCGSVCVEKTLEENTMTLRAEIIATHEEHHSIWQNQTTLKWCTKLGAEKRLLMRKERSDLENAIVEYYLMNAKETSTVDEVFQDWYQYERNHTEHAQKTVDEYNYDYKRFLAGSTFSSTPISSITEKDIVKFMKSLVYDKEPIPLKRYKSVKTILRLIFNHARLHMDIECITIMHILEDLTFPSGAFKDTSTSDEDEVFKHSEIRAIKALLKDTTDLDELGILLTIETGVRIGELCVLKRDCVSESYLEIKRSEHRDARNGYCERFVDEPKKKKHRTVTLNEDAKKIIQKILSLHNSDWLFPSKNDDSTWMRSYFFDKAIRKVCKRLGIKERSMHKLRKTHSSYLLSENVPEKLVQKQLGHADISTTQRAYHYNIFDDEEVENILGAIKIG